MINIILYSTLNKTQYFWFFANKLFKYYSKYQQSYIFINKIKFLIQLESNQNKILIYIRILAVQSTNNIFFTKFLIFSTFSSITFDIFTQNFQTKHFWKVH